MHARKMVAIFFLSLVTYTAPASCAAARANEHIHFKSARPLAELNSRPPLTGELIHFYGLCIGAVVSIGITMGSFESGYFENIHAAQDFETIFAPAKDTVCDKIIYGSSVSAGIAVSQILKKRYNNFFKHREIAKKILSLADCKVKDAGIEYQFETQYAQLRSNLDKSTYIESSANQCDRLLASLAPANKNPFLARVLHNKLCAEAISTYYRMKFVDGLTLGAAINPIVLSGLFIICKEELSRKTVEYCTTVCEQDRPE